MLSHTAEASNTQGKQLIVTVSGILHQFKHILFNYIYIKFTCFVLNFSTFLIKQVKHPLLVLMLKTLKMSELTLKSGLYILLSLSLFALSSSALNISSVRYFGFWPPNVFNLRMPSSCTKNVLNQH